MAHFFDQTTPTEYKRLQADINKSFQALNDYIVRLERENEILKKDIAENIALRIGTDYEEAKKTMRDYVACWLYIDGVASLRKNFRTDYQPNSYPPQSYPPKEHFLNLAAEWYIEEKIRNSDAEIKV